MAYTMKNRTRDLSVGAFFLILLVLGVFIHKDYGISWDEPQQRFIGQVAERYVIETLFPHSGVAPHQVPELSSFRDKDYGVVFELPAVAFERLFGLEDSRDIFFFRHLLNYFVFLAGVFALYVMVSRRLKDWRFGLIAALFLLLSPRFFADGFYNSKDIVFMATFTIALATMLSFLRNPTARMSMLHGFATGLAIDVRIMAVLIPLVTMGVLILKLLRRDIDVGVGAKMLGLYWLASALSTYLMFPFLWEAPVANLIQTFQNMSQFQRWGGEVLYFGEFVSGDSLPWHYVPVWISLTTPFLFVSLFIVGAVFIIRRAVLARFELWRNEEELQDLLMLGFFVGPILAVVVLGSVLYNGWRHLYFIYPAFLFVAVVGLSDIWRLLRPEKIARYAFACLIAAVIVYQVQWMVRAHPLQNVYFNFLAGSDLKSRFELDYWGLSNRKALEYILANDASERIVVVPGSFNPLYYSLLVLDPRDRLRLDIPVTRWPQNPEGFHYVVDNYLNWARHYDPSRYSYGYEVVHEIVVGGETISTIYRSVTE